MDSCDRELIDWRLARSGNAKTAEAALEEALIHRFGTLGRVSQPLTLRFDNGLVSKSKLLTSTVKAYRIEQEFTTPYTPEQNGLIERFIRTLKVNCIWQQRFKSLAHAQMAIGLWIRYYNTERLILRSATSLRGLFKRSRNCADSRGHYKPRYPRPCCKSDRFCSSLVGPPSHFCVSHLRLALNEEPLSYKGALPGTF